MPGPRAVQVTDDNFDEHEYLEANPDVAQAVRDGRLASGRAHFDQYGRSEGRRMGVERRSPSYSGIARALLALAKKITPRFIKQEINSHIQHQFQVQIQTRTQTPAQAPPQPLDQTSDIKDLQVQLQQVLSILKYELNIPPPPPKHLQTRVVTSYDPRFMDMGYTINYPTLNRVLEPSGKQLVDFPSILDFGCGCGRSTRALARLLPKCRIFGADIDREAIDWLNANYSAFAEFSVVPHIPPTLYADQMFDLVFGISVFTHLPEGMQFQWLQELSRITKPRGYVVLTTHGENYYKNLDSRVQEIMESTGFFYYDVGYGPSISLPEFYQVAYHSRAYIEREWSRHFDVLDIRAGGLNGKQDTVLLQNRVPPQRDHTTDVPPSKV